MHEFLKFILNKTLHISDSFSVNHQEFFTVHTAMVYVIQVCWQLASRIMKFILNKTLHVSDSFSVNHQEFFTVHTAMVYVIQVCWQLASRIMKFILNKTPHVSDSFSVNHQEFFTVHTAVVYVIQVCWQLRARSWSCSQAVSKLVWHTPLLCVQWETPDDGQRNCPKYVEYYSKINLRN